MDSNQFARSMALDFVYSVIQNKDQGEHAHDLVDESMSMGPEHLHEFLLHIAGIVEVVGRRLKQVDLAIFQATCHRIKNAPAMIPEDDAEQYSNEVPTYDENFDEYFDEKWRSD